MRDFVLQILSSVAAARKFAFSLFELARRERELVLEIIVAYIARFRALDPGGDTRASRFLRPLQARDQLRAPVCALAVPAASSTTASFHSYL